MKITKSLGMLLLAIWLIVGGAVSLLDVRLGQATILLPILAIVTGILILIGK